VWHDVKVVAWLGYDGEEQRRGGLAMVDGLSTASTERSREVVAGSVKGGRGRRAWARR
jgi:hypothetical protein